MAAEPITLSTMLDSDAPAEEVLTRLRQLPWGPAARLDQPDSTTLHISSGSKLRYRLMGARSGGEHLPLKAAFQLSPRGSGTSVRFTLTSDEGWYLFQTSLGRDAYQARFDGLLTAMKSDGIIEST
jgi:hypothetical protein